MQRGNSGECSTVVREVNVVSKGSVVLRAGKGVTSGEFAIEK